MKRLCKNKEWKLNKDYNIDKILYLLVDRPKYISSRNAFIWKNENRQFHRNYDLPSFIRNDGGAVWHINDF